MADGSYSFKKSKGANSAASRFRGNDLGSERATMRKVQQFNNKRRAAYEKYGFGVVAGTYRDKKGKLKAATVNRMRKK